MVVSLKWGPNRIYFPNNILKSTFFSALVYAIHEMETVVLKDEEIKMDYINQKISPRDQVFYLDFDLQEFTMNKLTVEEVINVARYTFVYFDPESPVELKEELKKVYIKTEDQIYLSNLIIN